MSKPGALAGEAPRRLESLDAFRGITVAAMVLVNNPGSWSAVSPPLRHAEWHGWTPTDLIFPSFLFIVGVAIPFALGRRIGSGAGRPAVVGKIVRRALILFGLGLLLAGFPRFDPATIRIPGVLQRIAVCYLAAALLVLATRPRAQAVVAAGLLLGYWALLALVPAPGGVAGDYSREGNLAAAVDRALLGGHTWKPDYDPEGLLSTLPALATTLLGALAGHWLRSDRPGAERCAGLFVAGAIACTVGAAWDAWFPINKALWTSSFAVLTAGVALQALGLCYWFIDLKGYRRWAAPFVAFGVNAIVVFVLSGLLARVLGLWTVATDAGPTPMKALLYEHAFASWARPEVASLLYATAYLALWIAVAGVMRRRDIVIKI